MYNRNLFRMSQKELESIIAENSTARAAFDAAIPAIIKVLTKYDGKKYGEKTKAKIAEETFNSCGYHLYMDKSMYNRADTAECFNAYSGNCATPDLYVMSSKPLVDCNNTIHASPSPADYTLLGHDSPSSAEDIISAKEELMLLAREVKEKINAINTLLPGGVNAIYGSDLMREV